MLEHGSKNDRQLSTLDIDNVGSFLPIAHDSVLNHTFAATFFIDVALEPVCFANLPVESLHVIPRSAISFHLLKHMGANYGNLILTSSEHVLTVFGKHDH